MNIASTQVRSPGFIRIPLQSSDLIPRLIDGFNEFLALKHEEKSRFTFDLHHGDEDDGYVRRSGDGYDWKSWFHYRPWLPHLLTRRGVCFKRQEVWFMQCEELFLRCEAALVEYAAHLHPAFAVPEMGQLIRNAASTHVLRLIHYDRPKTPGGLIGKAHKDRNFISIHVDESGPGLQFEPYEGMAEIQTNTGLMFPGKKAERFSDGACKAREHRIIGESVATERWSIVFFGHIEGTHLLEQ